MHSKEIGTYDEEVYEDLKKRIKKARDSKAAAKKK
jgi:hypothetical protein